MKIGFIGLGIMGKPMARNLMKAGHELYVYDILPAPVAELAAEGATAALAAALKVDLGLGKNIVDISVVTAAFLVDLLFGTLWTSIGLTTVISSIFNGRSVYLFNRLLRDRILALAGLEKEI